MSQFHALLLGIFQGLTEFLPVSSSGHLVLLEQKLHLPFSPSVLQDFDIVLHAGSLLAILLYYHRTWITLLRAPLARQADGGPPLLLLLIAATIPAGIAGLFSAGWIEAHARTPIAVALGFMITGGVLLGSSFYELHVPGWIRFSWKQAIVMGVGQAVALLPGISRSGFTLASGRLAGLSALRATELSFLLGAPALGAALLYTLLFGTADLATIGLPSLLTGFSTSLISSLLVIHLFLLCVRLYGVWIWSVYLFVAALLVLSDEVLPIVGKLQELGDRLPFPLLLSVLFAALLLEAIPLTSTFVPGLTTMATLGLLLSGSWLKILACIPIGTAAVVLGNLIGYLPARQALVKIHWKEKADERLRRAQRFFERWGIWAVFFGSWFGPIRALLSVAAGLGNMPPRRYLPAMILGAAVWVTMVLGGSAFLGWRLV